MTGARRGKGRRDNGLSAALWTPLRDVDPRVGEHLLEVLREQGIAAYLDPAADVGEYTRTVFLPSPPSDRLFVDRAQRQAAAQLVAEHADDHAPPPAPAPARGELDHEAEWARIVAALEADGPFDPPVDDPEPPARRRGDRPVPRGTDHADSAPEAPDVDEHPPAVDDAAVPGPAPAAGRLAPEDGLRPLEWAAPPEEHFRPPPPPPVPAPSPAALYALMLIAVGALLVVAPGVFGLTLDVGIVLGVLALAGGVAVLVSRMRDRTEDDDDGAVV